MQLKLTKWRPFSWHLYKRLNCDHWKISVTIDEAKFKLGGSYSRRRVCYIRKGHGDPSKLKCVKSDSFAQGFLASTVFSFYGKTEIRIIPKGSRSIRNIMLAKF